MKKSSRYRRYRAPAGNAQVFCDPPWQSLSQLIEQNSAAVAGCKIQIGGKPLAALRDEARAFLLDAAKFYTNSYADVAAVCALQGPIVVTGHQPGLHHPGVWLKNFSASRLANHVGGTAINIIIDGDLCRESSVQVPTGSVDNPRVVNIPLDEMSPLVPYEERVISNEKIWNSFGKVCAETIAPLIADPLVQTWWPEVIQLSVQRTLGETLSRARHMLEISWGNRTLEVPNSHLCRSEPFRRFALHLLASAEQFRTCHNGALADYRQAHRLRNEAQPVPDLAIENGWVETPFWIWSSSSPTRRALYACTEDSVLKLSDRSEFRARLEMSANNPTEQTLEQLKQLENDGIKLRTRALTTTMFARLFLADIFIHGIGGAKYDQVTDEICVEFFGVRPPAHATVTGTLRLPIDHPMGSEEQYRQLRQELRNLRYHPEVSIARDQLSEEERLSFDKLSNEKIKWINTAKTSENCEQRHEAIEQVNNQLGKLAASRRKEIVKELAELDHQFRADRLLESREYPFCLFPQSIIQDFLLDFTASIP